MLVWAGAGGEQGEQQDAITRTCGSWAAVVKDWVGGNKGKLLSFHYARYQGPREAFINNRGS